MYFNDLESLQSGAKTVQRISTVASMTLCSGVALVAFSSFCVASGISSFICTVKTLHLQIPPGFALQIPGIQMYVNTMLGLLFTLEGILLILRNKNDSDEHKKTTKKL